MKSIYNQWSSSIKQCEYNISTLLINGCIKGVYYSESSFSSQWGQNHFPLGAASRPTHGQWNHSYGHCNKDRYQLNNVTTVPLYYRRQPFHRSFSHCRNTTVVHHYHLLLHLHLEILNRELNTFKIELLNGITYVVVELVR